MQAETQTDLEQRYEKSITLALLGLGFLVLGSGVTASSAVKFHELLKIRLYLALNSLSDCGLMGGCVMLIIAIFTFACALAIAKDKKENKKIEEEQHNESVILQL
ncbi:MAG: hypothetical protein LBJ93_03880 [Clostridiales bacterium]|jgi:hypothetical protein|nr:hypothetical protein [Clostridiales bacterium]